MGATGTNQVRDPNIVKTKGNPGKVAMNVQKGRRCSRCKRVGHTIRKCPEATILKMLSRIAGFQQHEQSMSTPCEGGDPNKYQNEKGYAIFLFIP
ncbi:hypothetical protein CK203_106920 [Vitis vinifera]|uniref:CCHC-type domain-containing protein n=1 Tax=Vitis vinifera TaxID=29760 RepID=A0A438CDW3_VITVI|nr:hypothetical protein CK203_106920 [Vitis vinifera]